MVVMVMVLVVMVMVMVLVVRGAVLLHRSCTAVVLTLCDCFVN